MTKKSCLAFALAALLGVAPPAMAAPSLPSKNVAWVPAAADADVDRAFRQARAAGKPVLLYWGATWCPPCNQLKATLFPRAEFAALARSFVVVHVDGDRPGAQKLSRRFNVGGYPTLVVFAPDGTELTRLPGEAEPEQVLALMRLGLAGGRPAKAVLADFEAGRPLAPNDWKLLAFYSWPTDDGQLVPRGEVPATLAKLAAASAASDPETAIRLWLKALAESDDGKGLKPDDALRDRVLGVANDPALVRQHMDVIANEAAAIVKALAGDGAGSSPLVAPFDAALRRLVADATLSRGDRLSALNQRVSLARLGQDKDALRPRIPDALLREVREHVARDDRETADGYERMAVIPSAAYVLGRAGLWEESDALLKANLAKSHSPYYLMSQLGGNAKKQGRQDEALDWYRQSWAKSEGPATRLQWGSGYLAALVEMAPADAARIEKTAATLIAEAARDKGSFEGRSLRSLQRMGTRLQSWNADGRQAAAMKRLQAQLDGVCRKVDAADGKRAACQGLLAKKSA